jgi:hypothetical protein
VPLAGIPRYALNDKIQLTIPKWERDFLEAPHLALSFFVSGFLISLLLFFIVVDR